MVGFYYLGLEMRSHYCKFSDYEFAINVPLYTNINIGVPEFLLFNNIKGLHTRNYIHLYKCIEIN